MRTAKPNGELLLCSTATFVGDGGGGGGTPPSGVKEECLEGLGWLWLLPRLFTAIIILASAWSEEDHHTQ